MPLNTGYPRSLVQPFRKNALVLGAGFRGYFAPYNAALGSATANTVLGPTLLDLSKGPFTTASLQSLGFFDTGWIREFKLTPGTKIGQVRSGYRGAVRAQYRGQVDETFEFKFREYGRLQYKLATGTNVMNTLSTPTQATVNSPLGATGAIKVAMTAYNPANALYQTSTWPAGSPTLAVASTTGFAAGNFVVADIDYTPGTYGLVGSAGTPVYPGAVTDVDYIRRNSDYVAKIVSIDAPNNVLVLDQPFTGGGSGTPTGPVSPPAGSSVEIITGWTAREGGTFISEWTAMFLMDTMDISQVAVYYPHVSINSNKDIVGNWAPENLGTTDLTGSELDAMFTALAFDDPLDGETVVGYKAFYPAPNSGAIGY